MRAQQLSQHGDDDAAAAAYFNHDSRAAEIYEM